ncbi:protein SPMIP1-like [Argopecten irradians]|uniref:protein SPMIP1-like n=1 Tax=Argopecten irradians TaxID=31199 RepID=UPI00371B9B20
MARNYPASTQIQKFLEESYNKERDARLGWYIKKTDKSSSMAESKQSEVARRKIQNAPKPAEDLLTKLPEDRTPQRFNKKKSNFQDVPFMEKNSGEMLNVAMLPVIASVKNKLYDGFTKEGKGRYQYLCDRYKDSPEDKFQFPLLSSWEYGWRLADVVKKNEIKKPAFGRTRIVSDTFYTRTGIPSNPDYEEKW